MCRSCYLPSGQNGGVPECHRTPYICSAELKVSNTHHLLDLSRCELRSQRCRRISSRSNGVDIHASVVGSISKRHGTFCRWRCSANVTGRDRLRWLRICITLCIYKSPKRSANTQQLHYHGELPFRRPVILAQLPFTKCNAIDLPLLSHAIAR